MNYWLMKSEPDVFSIDDLERKKISLWDGVRNYQARNYMMKEMSIGDLVLFYHSNAKPSSVVGLAEVAKKAQPDPTQFDKTSEYYDAKSKPENPRWHCVSLQFHRKFKRPVSLDEIKSEKSLQKMLLLHRSRLSVQPVKKSEFDSICKMGGI